MSTSIRLASEADDSEVAELASRAGLTVDPSAERARTHAALLVAVEAEERPLGFALGWFVAGEMEVVDIAVAESCRGRGVGASLLRALLEEGRGRGCDEAFLEVREQNPSAQRLYKSQGFEEVGRRERYYQDGEDALLFRCCLKRGD